MSEAGPTAIVTDNRVTRYECSDVLGCNEEHLPFKYLEYGYELQYDCSNPEMSEADGMTTIGLAMLQSAKAEFMSGEDACRRPQKLWFAVIDSDPADYAVDHWNCTHFDGNMPENQNMCCSVVQGNMTFRELSQLDEEGWEDILEWSVSQFSTGLRNESTWAGYEAFYLGSSLAPKVETASDQLSPTTYSGLTQEQNPPANESLGSDFTLLGMGLVILLALAICCLGGIITRQYCIRNKYEEDREKDDEQSGTDDSEESKKMDKDENADEGQRIPHQNSMQLYQASSRHYNDAEAEVLGMEEARNCWTRKIPSSSVQGQFHPVTKLYLTPENNDVEVVSAVEITNYPTALFSTSQCCYAN